MTLMSGKRVPGRASKKCSMGRTSSSLMDSPGWLMSKMVYCGEVPKVRRLRQRGRVFNQDSSGVWINAMILLSATNYCNNFSTVVTVG